MQVNVQIPLESRQVDMCPWCWPWAPRQSVNGALWIAVSQ